MCCWRCATPKPSRSAATAATWDVSSPTKDVSRPKPFKMVPTRIACSSATRARQTCDRMLKVFGDDPKVDYRQSLYEGGVQSVFDELAQTKEKHRTLLVLGHEPTISIACQWLASTESDPTLLDLLNLGMSPASIAVFGSNEPFNQWQLHSGELIALLTAKDFE